MKGDQSLLLAHGAASDSTQFLHVSSHAKDQAQMHTKNSQVGPRLATDPEHSKVPSIVELVDLALVDRSNAQCALDSWDEGRSLEDWTGELLDCATKLGFPSWQGIM